MKLSESETHMVKNWEWQERDWQWQRWIFLIMCSLLVVVFTLVFRWFVPAPSEDHAVKLIAVWNPFVCMVLMASIYRLVETVRHWRGDMKTKLLLRLMAEHERGDA